MTSVDEGVHEPPTSAEDPAARRMLMALLGLLVVLATVLLVALVWMLRPDTSEALPSDVDRSACPIESVGAFQRFGPEEGAALFQPLAVTFDARGHLWVSDTGNSRMVVLTESGELVRTVGDDDGPGGLMSPYGAAVDPVADRVYVADWTRGEVVVFSAEGRYVESLPAPDQDRDVFGELGFSPFEVRLHEGMVVVASNDGLYGFDRDGRVVERWGGEGRGSAPDQFDFPDAFDIDPDSGHIYVADTLNRRIVALDADGEVRWISGTSDVDGEISGFWQLPRSLTVGPDGNIYVVDTFRFQRDCAGAGHVVVLSPDGELLSEFGAAGAGPDELNFPEKLAISPDGQRFAVADRENARVLLFGVRHLPPPSETEAELHARSLRRGAEAP
jgi:DNA-binding beta-propeller fold protein YncE